VAAFHILFFRGTLPLFPGLIYHGPILYTSTMFRSTSSAIVAAVILICVVVIIAAVATVAAVEKDVKRLCTKAPMTSVFGKSFATLTHGNLDSEALHPLAHSSPFRFSGSQVAGASFSHM